MANKISITDELLAAFLDGNTNEAETRQILQAVKTDAELQETLDIVLQLESKKFRFPRVAKAQNAHEASIAASDQKEQRRLAKKTVSKQPRKLLSER